MEKVWIINNSLFGNSERLSHEIAEKLKGNYETKVIKIRKMNIAEISKEKVDILIVGARIIAFRADRKLRSFLKKKLPSLIEGSIQKMGIFYTHKVTWKAGFRKKMDKTLKKLPYVKNIIPEILSIKTLDDKKGILEEGYEEKLGKFVQMVIS